jgi:hypothetical protein
MWIRATPEIVCAMPVPIHKYSNVLTTLIEYSKAKVTRYYTKLKP